VPSGADATASLERSVGSRRWGASRRPRCTGFATYRARLRCTMSHQESELLATILRLPSRVRAQFAHEILASLDDWAEPGAEEHWQAEVERRADEVLAGRADLEDADVVHEQLTARLRAVSR
jgi:hypothetical protein